MEINMDLRSIRKDSVRKAQETKINLHNKLKSNFPDLEAINLSFSLSGKSVIYNLWVRGEFGAPTLVKMEDYLDAEGFNIVKMKKGPVGTIMGDYCGIRRGQHIEYLKRISKC